MPRPGLAVPVLFGRPKTYDERILDLKPIGFWKLDELKGSVALDSSGNGFHGQYVNTVQNAGPANLIGNPGFETAGAGGADVFGTWEEAAGDGTITRTTTAGEFHGGAAAVKLTVGATSRATISQVFAVIPGQTYTLTCWVRGDGVNTGSYHVYNAVNWSNIVAETSVGVTGTEYTQKTFNFVTPAGCTGVQITFRACAVQTVGALSFIDDVAIYPANSNLLTNGGFEALGAGDADVFANWMEEAGAGTIERTTTAGEVHSDGAAARLTQAAAFSSNTPKIYPSIVCVPGQVYTITLWTRGDGTNSGLIQVWDATNSATINVGSLGVPGTTYQQVAIPFTAPTNCLSIGVMLRPAQVNNAVAYFDDVEVRLVAPNGIGDGSSAPYFNGSTSYVNIYSPGLASRFNGNEGTIFAWAKVPNAATWTDGVNRGVFQFGVDGSNFIYAIKGSDGFYGGRNGSGAGAQVPGKASTSTDWCCVAAVWSASTSTFVGYLNGQLLDIPTGGAWGAWAGALAYALIGVNAVTPSNCFAGLISKVALFDRALSVSEVLAASQRQRAIWSPAYSLYDTFDTAQAAPLASPRTCEPGPGTLTIADTENKLSVSGGRFVLASGRTSPASGDPGVWGNANTRVAGLTTLVRASLPSTAYLTRPLGWDSDRTGAAAAYGLNCTTGGLLTNRETGEATVGLYSAATDYDFALPLRGTGCFHLFKLASASVWTLVWVSNADSTATLYPEITTYNGPLSADNFRVVNLGTYDSRFSSDYGLATSRLVNPAVNATAAHQANAVIEWTFTHSAATETRVALRRIDTNNHWFVQASLTGGVLLYARVAGVNTLMASLGGVFTDGQTYRVVVVAQGNVYTVYVNNVLKITYTDATNFNLTAIALWVYFTGGGISEVICWPRFIALPQEVA